MDRLYMIVNRKTGDAKLYTNPPKNFWDDDWKSRLPHVAGVDYVDIICECLDGVTGYDDPHVPCCCYSSELAGPNGASYMVFLPPKYRNQNAKEAIKVLASPRSKKGIWKHG